MAFKPTEFCCVSSSSMSMSTTLLPIKFKSFLFLTQFPVHSHVNALIITFDQVQQMTSCVPITQVKFICAYNLIDSNFGSLVSSVSLPPGMAVRDVISPCDPHVFDSSVEVCLSDFNRSLETSGLQDHCAWPAAKRWIPLSSPITGK